MTATAVPTVLLPAALALARANWRVLPCRPHDGPHGRRAKSPLIPHGLTAASTDPEVVTAWWTRYPDALIGAVVPDHLIVVDVDPWHGGTCASLEHAAGRLPPTLTCRSGRGDGGVHLYYLAPPGELNETRLPAGVDLRKGGRAYCIVPPSPHPITGRPYTWDSTRAPAPTPPGLAALLAPAPPSRLLWAPPPTVTSNRVSAWLQQVAGAPEGKRNALLFWAGCRAAEAGLFTDIRVDLADAATAAGLDSPEIERTLRSVEKRFGL